MSHPDPRSPQTPISFKTVPGRNRTQKWQQAKTYNYDGDDWGGYDPYDEYGGHDEDPPGPPQPPFAQRPQRQNSFDTGDERRQFSQGYEPDRRASPARSAVSSMSGSRASNDHERRQRVFTNPEAAPPPLNMRSSPAHSGPPPSTQERFPPRQSSITEEGVARDSMPKPTEKALPTIPFIRPSDIYKRMAEEKEKERERQSMDSSRPSMDSVRREGTPSASAAKGANSPANPALGRTASLEPVMERREHEPQSATTAADTVPVRHNDEPLQEPGSMLASNLRSNDDNMGSSEPSVRQKEPSPVLPPVSRVSGFGSDFLLQKSPTQESPQEPMSGGSRSSWGLSRTGRDTVARVLNSPVVSTAGEKYNLPSSPTTVTPSTTESVSHPSNIAADALSKRENDRPDEDIGTRSMAPDTASSSLQQTPTDAFPSEDRDHAADILAERQHSTPIHEVGRHMDSVQHTPTDPQLAKTQDHAADILSERQHSTPIHEIGRQATADGSLRDTPAMTQPSSDMTKDTSAASQALTNHDHAADILAERQHSEPVHSIGKQTTDTTDLQHQPSSGFRSVVNKAFDRDGEGSVPVSRDNSQSMGSGAGGVSRSDTNSTSSISPIMSRVPSAVTPQQRQLDRYEQVPPIAEESNTTPTQPQPASGILSAPQQIMRKPSPSHSRNVSADSSGPLDVQPGYRRSLDPPSSDNSPARSPGLENASSRRVSGPMVAETVAAAETPAVVDQAAEVPMATLQPSETPAKEIEEPIASSSGLDPPPTMGRTRSGTDYSTREVDAANTVNASSLQPSFTPPMADEQRVNQQTFLQTHAGMSGPSSPTSPSARATSPYGLGLVGTGSSVGGNGTGRESPAPKSRVREIAQSYNAIEESSRRNSAVSSKSSWSNFRGGSEENLSLKRKGTGGSLLTVESPAPRDDSEEDGMFPSQESNVGETGSLALPAGAATAAAVAGASLGQDGRPQVQSQQSFRPHLPGEWVSFAPTPVGEEGPMLGPQEAEPETAHEREWQREDTPASPITPRASHMPPPSEEEPIDLTPTTKKTQLREGNMTASGGSAPMSALMQVKNAGEALGASLMSTAGLTSQSRDFASSAPAEPVQYPEMQPRPQTGEYSGYLKPHLARYDSEATEAPSSVASSRPPTPPAKDTPQPPPANNEPGPAGRPISSYFSGAVPPLNVRSGQSKANSNEQRPGGLLPTLSTDTGVSDTESDRLRKEIVRSLDPMKKEEIKRESIMEDDEQPPGLKPAPAKIGPSKLMLDQRFSWENRPDQPSQPTFASSITAPSATTTTAPAEEKEPEIKPEAPYERPRSRNLHVMNTNVSRDTDDSSEEEEERAEEQPALRDPVQAEKGMSHALPVGVGAVGASAAAAGLLPMSPVSPVNASQENLRDAASSVPVSAGTEEDRGMKHLDHSPVADHADEDEVGPRLPSYYQSDAARSSAIPAPLEKDTSSPVSPSTAAKGQSGQRIPPFREILAIRSTSDRIKAYDSTRDTFAQMDTGLNDWLSNMLTQHPEHANLSMAAPSGPSKMGPTLTSGVGTFRHKHSPSIIKFTKQFTNPSGPTGEGSDGVRKTSASGPSSYAGATPGGLDRTPTRGKDIMKTAGVFGGKAQAGAKGLLAKGRSRFGGGKRDSADGKAPPASASSMIHSSNHNQDYATSTPQLGPPPPPPPPPKPTSSLDHIGAAPPVSASPSLNPPSTSTTPSSSSPLPRVRSHTPTSRQSAPSTPALAPASGSRPFSQAFSRLRERSRSKSTTRSSRPSSLVIPPPAAAISSSELVLDTEDEALFRNAAAKAAAARQRVDVRFGSGNDGGNGMMQQHGRRVEAWEDEGVHGSASGIEGGRDEGRLGVLPSPTAEGSGKPEGFGRDEGGMVTEDESVGGENRRDRELVSRIPSGAEPEAVGEPHINKMPIATMQQPEIQDLQENTNYSLDHAQASDQDRPQQERKVSALASLPSQQRGVGVGSPATPRSPAFHPPRGTDEDEEDLYGATPTATKARSPADAPAEAEELYGTTPLATQTSAPWRAAQIRQEQEASSSAQQSPVRSRYRVTNPAVSDDEDEVSRPTTAGEGQWDRRSEVSAEDHFVDANEGKKGEDFGPSDSRRSSVSSLGSPDTVLNRSSTVMRPHSSVQQTPTKELPPIPPAEEPAEPVSPEQQQQLHNAPLSAVQMVMQPSALQRSASARDPTPQQQGFMNRSYKYGGGQQDRPVTYTPLARDMSESPAQVKAEETVDTEETPIDLTGLSGPPTGTPPFQQHPVFRNSTASSQPTEYDRLRSPRPDSTVTSATHSRQVSTEAGDRRSKRYSFFRGSDKPDTPAFNTTPAPHAISPHFGLEDIANTGVDDIQSAAEQPAADKQSKRRSGLWESFKRSPGVSRTSSIKGSSVAPAESTATLPSNPALIAANKARENTAPRAKTLQKPQRAVSAATPPTELKKKPRFSRLGSLFGRSNTQGHNTAKPNKLTKMQPPSRENTVRHDGAPNTNAGDYSAYEAMRRQQNAEVQRQSSSQQVPPSRTSSLYQPRPETAIRTQGDGVDNSAPLEGYYSPDRDLPGNEYFPAPEPREAPSPYRRLHSEGSQRAMSYTKIPEAFRPVEASYGRPAAPIGPPVEYQSRPSSERPPISQQPTLPTRQPYWSGGVAPVVMGAQTQPIPQRQTSYGSYQSEVPQQGQRRPDAQWSTREQASRSLPPVRTNMGSYVYPSDVQQTVDPTDEELARSPAREYADQQTPYPISLPHGGANPQMGSRVPSWGPSSNGQQRRGSGQHAGAYPSPPPDGHNDLRSLPPGMQRYSQPMAVQAPGSYQRQDYRTSHSRQSSGYYDREPQDYASTEDSRYPSPSYNPRSPSGRYSQPPPSSTFQAPPMPPPQQQRYSYDRSEPPRQQYGQGPYPATPQQQRPRYYAGPPPSAQGFASPPPLQQPYGHQQQQEGRPLTYQRTTSGYTGRRDDMAVSEDKLFGTGTGMRGASYPGQEWVPGSHQI